MWHSPQPGHKFSSDTAPHFNYFFSPLSPCLTRPALRETILPEPTDLGEGKYPIQAHQKPKNYGTTDAFPQLLLSTTSTGLLYHNMGLHLKELQVPTLFKTSVVIPKENTEHKSKDTRGDTSL